MKTKMFGVGIFLAGVLGVFAQPIITNQPQGQSNVVGSMVTLSVGATGTPPLFHQWRRQNLNVTGETNAVLVIASLQNSNAGNYTVVITNAQGAVTSAVALVRVLVPPAITTQPLDREVAVGDAAALSVVATGTTPAYQWRRNDVNLPGSTTATLTFPSVVYHN